jgi:hypothetical protein
VDGLKLSSAMGNRNVRDMLDLAQVHPLTWYSINECHDTGRKVVPAVLLRGQLAQFTFQFSFAVLEWIADSPNLINRVHSEPLDRTEGNSKYGTGDYDTSGCYARM